MPERSSKKKRPCDLNVRAAAIVAEATSETESEAEPEAGPEKNPHAQALGRLGGLKGGKARAAKLTPAQRREIAKKAADARWAARSE